jgi:hypothetical protein
VKENSIGFRNPGQQQHFNDRDETQGYRKISIDKISFMHKGHFHQEKATQFFLA